MLKKTMLTWLGALLVWCLWSGIAMAESSSVQVSIVKFPVKVNGQMMNNKQLDYPFVVYKDVTYIPLNWDLMQELELNIDWTAAEGLKIYRSCCTSPYWMYPALEKTKYVQSGKAANLLTRTYSAKVATAPIQLWGAQIVNDKEEYPFLEFRDVTYMPLTWTFAHTRLMMDLQFSLEEGLSIWSGQDQVLQQIVYDDAEALYVDALGKDYKTYAMMKIDKKLQTKPEWIEKEQAQNIRDKAAQDAQAGAYEGKKVAIERVGNSLTYEGFQLGELRKEEQGILGDTKLQIEGTLYEIDSKRKLLAVYTYFPIAVIGPPPSSRYQLFAIIDGQLRPVTNYPYKPQHVVKNTDGSVWIARDRMPFRDFYFRGSGLLALMDINGNIRLANEVWNEQDISPLGFNSPTRNPVEPDGRLIVRLYGKSYTNELGIDPSTGLNPLTSELIDPQKDGLYEVLPTLELRKLSKAPDDGLSFYRDSEGDIYTIQLYSNTVTNWTQNRSKTWSDIELLQ
ncbi:hypothetical protein OB236_03205 [Paenibacillus sp. WQ 127069]|uniref:Copper amine oxidase-like N-terminal domain-containing protein n=1 Tax=Paenibacillus baimaensis TaxID=2982185 RepID=A0ABT2U912_9BACL|nr:hypothetical protein [Paenibacillus sp. WQ 127069]MCU6791131.1 hypothetical protein [Paenibacillus sp. WQ 127069]